ncbi:ATPase [Terribacillus saccharophilus]|uniref:ATPase n=1 Tax=Terribacillus saccharophilus TaxID=361277 RepID=UPI00398279E2
MHKKQFWFPLLASILTIVFLYTIGNSFDITLLSWTFYETHSSEEVVFEAGGSLIPVLIGTIVGFITEKVMKNKQKNEIID